MMDDRQLLEQYLGTHSESGFSELVARNVDLVYSAALRLVGGLILLIAGVTFVRRDGVRASRLRVFWRGLVAGARWCWWQRRAQRVWPSYGLGRPRLVAVSG